MISFKQSGDFKNTESFLTRVANIDHKEILHKYGKEGVLALSKATPKQSGTTANCWSYKIIQNGGSLSITWTNSNIVNGVPIAIIIQYGHATKNGGYVQGRDYINPTMRPLFDSMAEAIWREVTKK